MRTFRIHESNIDRLHVKINRIRNKCNKYGCDFYYAEVGEEFKVLDEGTDEERVAKYIVVECEGTAKVNGWQFVATLEHTPGGNIIRNIVDIDIPERFRYCEPECEHCNSHRHRKDTYIVYNEESGEFKQVGSSCLADFTGGLSAEMVAGYISLFDKLIQGEAPVGGYRFKTYYNVEDILKYAIDSVDNLGYRSTQYNDSTKDAVIDAWNYDNGRGDSWCEERVLNYRETHHPDYNSEDLKKRVDDIKSYILSSDDDSDYVHNLKVILKGDYLEYRQIGYAVSSVKFYNTAIEKDAEEVRRNEAHREEVEASNYIGEVGDRITVEGPEVSIVTSWDTQWGTTVRYKIVSKGNVFMWDSSSFIDPHREVISFVGTVKKHDEYDDVKQTWLTRCRVKQGRLLREIGGTV